MPYIQRDADGKIVALVSSPTEDAKDKVSISDPEVLDFLVGDGSGQALQEFLSATDSELARVVEDLITLMVEKNLLLFTELPAAAQRKLVNRKHARDVLSGDESPMIDNEKIL